MCSYAYDFEDDGIYYTITDEVKKTVEVSNNGSYNQSYSGDVNIPASVIYNSSIYSVTSIGSQAFCNCWGLANVTIPSSVTIIGNEAFAQSGLQNIAIPEGVTTIGSAAFRSCHLSNVTLPSSVTTIYGYAFAACWELRSVVIPASVTCFDCGVFAACQLESLMVDEHNPKYDSRDNCNAVIETSTNTLVGGCVATQIPNSVEKIGYAAFQEVPIPSDFSFPNSIRSIEDYAFGGAYFIGSTISIPNSVTSIGDDAFSNSNLKSITIPNSVKHIGQNCFGYCRELTTATLPDGITEIANSLFSSCYELSDVTIPLSVTSIGTSAFANCGGLTSVKIPNLVTTIGDSAFDDCGNLVSATIGNSVKSIGDRAFYGCRKLTDVKIPNTLTSIGSSAFTATPWYESYKTNTNNINGNIVYIGNVAYEASTPYISECTFKDNTVSIAPYAFNYCEYLTNVIIPNNVKEIGSSAFQYCRSLRSVTIGSGVTTIAPSTFYGCKNLTNVTIPNSVTSIDDYAFYECTELAAVTIPNTVTYIGKKAFDKTAWYNAFIDDPNNIYGNIIYINDVAYSAVDKSITNCTFKENTSYIAPMSFYGCSNLSTVSIPNGVKGIGENAFANCISLTSFTIPDGVTEIGKYAFLDCINLAEITMPNSLTSIGYSAFSGCAISSLVIPENVKTIDEWAFTNCHNLKELTCYATEVPWMGNEAFYNINYDESILYVPESSVEAYKADKRWSGAWHTIVGIGTNVDSDTPDTDISEINNTIYLDNCETFCGKTIELPIKMKNDIVATGFQFDIILPEGITAVQDEDGFYDITLSTDRTTSAKTNTFDSSLMSDGSIRVLAASTRNYAFSGNDGEVCKIKLNVSEDLPAGDYPIVLKNIELTNAQGKTWNVERLKRTITVKDYQLGDANGDGRVSVGDFSAIANHILGSTPEGFNLGAADANLDNNISVGDLSTVATMILTEEAGGASMAKAKARRSAEVSDPNNYIYADPVVISEDGDATIVFNMKNEIAATGFQFNFTLPEGFYVTEDEDGFLDVFLSQIRTTSRKTNTFDCVKWSDGSYRVLAASTKNYEFTGNDGEVVTVHIKKNDDVESGNYALVLTDIELTNAQGATFRTSRSSYTITVPSNSNEVELVDGETYDNPTTATYDQVTFTKTFSTSQANKWNAFYVPMSINVEDYAGELDFAELYAFCATVDTNHDGNVDADDENYLLVHPVKAGNIKPNVPYLVRPHEAKTYTINSADNVLYGATAGKVEFATALDKFTVTGLNEAFTVTAGDNNYYVSSTGSLDYRTTGSTTVKANRWVMHRESKEYGSDNGSASQGKSYKIIAIGEDMGETTAIELIKMSNGISLDNADVYTIDGRKVNADHKLVNGIYIKGGKKFVVK